MYSLGINIGGFAVMIVIMIFAISYSKRAAGWVFYGIGAIVQLISLLGQQMKYSEWVARDAMRTNWITYIVLLLITAVIICIRRKQPPID